MSSKRCRAVHVERSKQIFHAATMTVISLVTSNTNGHHMTGWNNMISTEGVNYGLEQQYIESNRTN